MPEIYDEPDKRFTKKKAAKLDSKYIRAPKRVLIKNEGSLPANAVKGQVVYAVGKVFGVKKVDENNTRTGKIIECVPAGTIISEHDKTTLIAAGDFVHFAIDYNPDNPEYQGVILKVEPRTSILSRKGVYNPNDHVVAANADNLIILMSAAEPFYNKRLIDRYMVAAEQGEITPVLCINKIDLMGIDFLKDDLSIYEALGIKTFFTCALSGRGVEDLEEYLRNKTSVFSGPSGVGKSTLINRIFGYDIQEINAISGKTGKGRHTTSYAELFELPSGGGIIDTPGIRELGIIEMPPEELALYFHDFDEFRGNCRFMPCTHTHEPGCAVKGAVENGLIDPERYLSYVNIFNSLED